MRGTVSKKLRSSAENSANSDKDYSFKTFLKTAKKYFNEDKDIHRKDKGKPYKDLNGIKGNKRKVKFNESENIKPCPKCKNNTKFTIQYERHNVKEMKWEIFAVCRCGNEIPKEKRYISDYNSLGDAFIDDAMKAWNKHIN